jgi:hypothetical protein
MYQKNITRKILPETMALAYTYNALRQSKFFSGKYCQYRRGSWRKCSLGLVRSVMLTAMK